MDAEDGHSIWQQIWRATYNAAAYRTVNKGVELAPEAIEGGRQLNGLLYNLLTECFFEAECVRIRRLVESGRDGLDKKRRAVYSLGVAAAGYAEARAPYDSRERVQGKRGTRGDYVVDWKTA